MTQRRDAIRALRAADAALDAYRGPLATVEEERLTVAVETAYANPHLPDRYRDPRDRADAHKLRCKCARPDVDVDAEGYCAKCGCTV